MSAIILQQPLFFTLFIMQNENSFVRTKMAEMISSGMAAIVGPPNAGKSTLLNALLRQKISIVSPKPQTTRNRIAGIVNGGTAENAYQIVFLDTPGLHKAREPLNAEMVRIALESLSGVEVVLFLVDVSLPLPPKIFLAKGEEFRGYLGQIEEAAQPLVVLNKIDLITKEQLLTMIAAYKEMFGEMLPDTPIIPISARTKDGVERLLGEIVSRMPKGPRYFPDDIPTDASERFLCAEIIREKVFLQTGQEIPYSTAVVIDAFEEERRGDAQKGLVAIYATIVIERPSQKGIIIGKGGSKLKAIGSSARKDIEKLLGEKVLLKLWVKVKKRWSEDSNFMRELGF